MRFPTTQHLQNAVLSTLYNSDKCGKDIREELKTKYKISKFGPAFYQLMDRLEKTGMIKGWYEPVEIKGRTAKERWYKIMGKGRQALTDATSYYQTIAEAL